MYIIPLPPITFKFGTVSLQIVGILSIICYKIRCNVFHETQVAVGCMFQLDFS